MKLAIRVAMFVVCLAPVTALAQTALAQEAPQASTPAAPAVVQKLFRPDSKIAFVDLQRIFSESDYGVKGMAQVTALPRIVRALPVVTDST